MTDVTARDMTTYEISAFLTTAVSLLGSLKATPLTVGILNSRTFNATFATESDARIAALALGSVLFGIRICPVVTDCSTTTLGIRVWRLIGMLYEERI